MVEFHTNETDVKENLIISMETLNGAERNKGRFLGDGSTYLHIQEKGRRCIRIYQFLKIHLVVL